MDNIFHSRLWLVIWVSVVTTIGTSLLAQPIYVMQNLTVSDCEGTLTDSDEGLEQGQYNHNEDFTFTICVDNADEIRLNFDFFATEVNLDILHIYDGPDTNSPLISSLSGIINPPPLILSTSGCVTLHFTSDESIAAAGWSLNWEVAVNEPDLPMLLLPEPPDCPLSSLQFEVDFPIPCDQFTVDAFTIVGPGGYSVGNIELLDCDSSTMMASSFNIIFSSEIDIPGSFRLLFEGNIFDACGEAHPFSTNVLFEVANCPISVDIEQIERACRGDCGILEAIVRGNDAGDFTYIWSPSGPNSAEIPICADTATQVVVEVTDQTSGSIARDTFIYIPFPEPNIISSFSGDTVCSSRGDQFLSGDPAGGLFYSSIIPDWERETGRYQFWRWNWSSDLNEDIIEYVDPNGCRTTDTVWVHPVWAGSPQSSCQGNPSFELNGGNPAGGIWSGMHTTADGVFDPVESGSFVVSYTAANGCVSSKTVRVLDTIIMPDIDTICRTQRVFLEAEPFGGRWSGPGIVNNVNGRLDGWRPSPGSTYTYQYQLEGCSAEMQIHIRDIQAGPDRTRCMGDSLLFVSFPGDWSGPAPYIDSIQAFDISNLDAGTHDFTFSANGCSDRFELQLIDVRIEEDNPLFFCLTDDSIALDEFISFFPANGVLNGPGIFFLQDQYFFNPILSGPGIHSISWDALGCSDTLWLEVAAPADIPDYSFCDLSTAEVLSATPAGGFWRGPGFLDESAGLFDPQSLPIGIYTIYYIAPNGCETESEVEIFEFEEAEFIDLSQQYCFNDSLIEVQVQPAGGRFSINGSLSSLEFQPSSLGSGNHELLYERGAGDCASSDRIFISILPPIEGTVSAAMDTLCPDQSTEIGVESTGGRGQRVTTWDQGLGFGSSHIIRPTASSWYTVRVEDDCSLPYVDSIFIFQHAPFTFDQDQGPAVCYEDSTFVEISLDTADYQIQWSVGEPYIGARYTGPPGVYPVEITNRGSGCSQADIVELLGSPPIRANMTRIPNQDCISNIENEIEIIDLSVGYTRGFLDFGDGTPVVDFQMGSNLGHAYLDTGTFTIQLWVENELGCRDSISTQICVENIARIYVPNVFSPNGDGKNDEFFFTSYGIKDVEWAVFNRYGEQMFESRSELDTWDGTYKGKVLDTGVYVVRIMYSNIGTGESGYYHGSITLVR